MKNDSVITGEEKIFLLNAIYFRIVVWLIFLCLLIAYTWSLSSIEDELAKLDTGLPLHFLKALLLFAYAFYPSFLIDL